MLFWLCLVQEINTFLPPCVLLAGCAVISLDNEQEVLSSQANVLVCSYSRIKYQRSIAHVKKVGFWLYAAASVGYQ